MKAEKTGERATRTERKEAEEALDQALEDSFPASDPLPTTRTSAGAPDEPEAKRRKRAS